MHAWSLHWSAENLNMIETQFFLKSKFNKVNE